MGRDDSERPALLWVTERYPPQKGGMAASCGRLVRGLRERGFRVDLLVFSPDRSNGLVREESRDGGTDLHVSMEPGHGNAAQVAFRVLARRHEVRAYGAVVGFGAAFPGLVAVTFGAWMGCPAAVLVRGNDFDRDWFEPRRRAWVAEALSRARVIGAVSPDQVDRIRALFPNSDVRWTPNGVDSAYWSTLLERDRAVRDRLRQELGEGGRKILGLFGELKFKKGVEFLLAALRRGGLRDKVSLLVVGHLDAASAQVLEDPALHPGPKRILSYVPREDVAGYYAACDFVALPSLFDGMPNVLLEAMAAGAVPLVSDVGGLSSVVEDGVSGFVFPTEDSRDMAGVLARALALDDRELSRMQTAARDRVSARFSVAREVDRLAGLLLEVAEP